MRPLRSVLDEPLIQKLPYDVAVKTIHNVLANAISQDKYLSDEYMKRLEDVIKGICKGSDIDLKDQKNTELESKIDAYLNRIYVRNAGMHVEGIVDVVRVASEEQVLSDHYLSAISMLADVMLTQLEWANTNLDSVKERVPFSSLAKLHPTIQRIFAQKMQDRIGEVSQDWAQHGAEITDAKQRPPDRKTSTGITLQLVVKKF